MPVLAIGGEKSFGPMMATVMRFAASDVTEGDHSRFRPLDHGGEPHGDDRHGPRLPVAPVNELTPFDRHATVGTATRWGASGVCRLRFSKPSCVTT